MVPSPSAPTSTKTRPKRFMDAMKLRDSRRAPGLRSRDEDEEDGPDPRELARQRRLERKEAESSDRLEYLAPVIRQELVARSLSSPSTAKPVSFDSEPVLSLAEPRLRRDHVRPDQVLLRHRDDPEAATAAPPRTMTRRGVCKRR